MGNTLGDRLRALREQSGKTQRELAALLCINRVSYTQYENNKRTPPPDTLRKLAIIFNVSVDYLLGNDVMKANAAKKGVKIPVLGRVVAGVPIDAVQEILDYEEITPEMAATGEYFALQVKGASMEPTLRDGDIVIVKKQPTVEYTTSRKICNKKIAPGHARDQGLLHNAILFCQAADSQCPGYDGPGIPLSLCSCGFMRFFIDLFAQPR